MKALFELANDNKDVVLITGDLGFGLFEDFSEKFPSQFINIGIAEQNMVGVASGLALEGKIVFVYSIGNFPTLRCLEQIRNDICYHDLNVNIIASGGGFSYGALGMSHHATEDISIMRSLPNMDVLVPSSTVEVKFLMKYLYEKNTPGYLRLDKSKVEISNSKDIGFLADGVNILKDGVDITLIAIGGVANNALNAAKKLLSVGIDCKVLSLYSTKDIDIGVVTEACKNTNGIITIEESNLNGGVGSAIAEVCMDNNLKPKIFHRIGINNKYAEIVGSQDYLQSYFSLDSESIFKCVKELML